MRKLMWVIANRCRCVETSGEQIWVERNTCHPSAAWMNVDRKCMPRLRFYAPAGRSLQSGEHLMRFAGGKRLRGRNEESRWHADGRPDVQADVHLDVYARAMLWEADGLTDSQQQTSSLRSLRVKKHSLKVLLASRWTERAWAYEIVILWQPVQRSIKCFYYASTQLNATRQTLRYDTIR